MVAILTSNCLQTQVQLIKFIRATFSLAEPGARTPLGLFLVPFIRPNLILFPHCDPDLIV